jgi:hypothetical protein
MSKYKFEHRNFQAGHPSDLAHSWLLYDIARYYFEFLRNLFVLGGFYYITTKTQSGLLGLITVISFCVFLMQIQSFVTPWNLILFSYRWPNKWGLLLDLFLNGVLTLVLFVGSVALVIYCVSLISAAQFR